MYEFKAEDLKKHLEQMLSPAEVTHAYFEEYGVHLLIIYGRKTTDYLYIKNDRIEEMIDQINKFAIEPLKKASEEKRYYLDKKGIQIVDEEFDTFIRARQGSS